MDRHEHLKTRVRCNPELVGLDHIITVQEEVPCHRRNGNLYCQPDLLFHTQDGPVVVEIKSTDRPDSLRKLERQLRRAHIYFSRCGIDVRTIGVYQNEQGIHWYEWKRYEHNST